jgi:hypothetical protein
MGESGGGINIVQWAAVKEIAMAMEDWTVNIKQ